MNYSSDGITQPAENHQISFTDTHETTEMRSKHLPWIDRLGALMAGMCAVHCFVFMLGSVVLGFTASSLIFAPGLRWLMVFLVASLSVGSLFVSKKCHGQSLPGWLMVVGLAAIITANLWGIWSLKGEVLSLCGGLILAAGHLTQLSRTRLKTGPIKASRGGFWARNLALLFLLVAGVMAVIQLPSLSKSLNFWGGEFTGDQAGNEMVGWEVLAQLDIYSGEVGPELRNVIGSRVKIPGYIVPLDESGKTFLLAPYAGACIHGPTPPMNQIIYVMMQAGATPIDPWSWEPIWVTGTLEILEIDSPFGSAGFKMDGNSAEIYR